MQLLNKIHWIQYRLKVRATWVLDSRYTFWSADPRQQHLLHRRLCGLSSEWQQGRSQLWTGIRLPSHFRSAELVFRQRRLLRCMLEAGLQWRRNAKLRTSPCLRSRTSRLGTRRASACRLWLLQLSPSTLLRFAAGLWGLLP